MRLDFSMFDVPERTRFDSWSDAIFNAAGVSAEPPNDRSAPFQGRFSGRISGPLGYCEIAVDGHSVLRRPADIARKPLDCYCIYREGSAGVLWRQGGQEFVTRAGDLIITDIDAPYETRAAHRFTHQAWAVPKALLDPHLPSGMRRPLSVLLSGRVGVEALASTYLGSVTQNWDELAGPAMNAVADTLCRLIGVACGSAAPDQQEAVRQARLSDAKRYIDRNLADPNLSPAMVAAALGISLRALHSLFEPTGISWARHVQRRRLEECRTALLANPTRPVLDIAMAWGFGSVSSFYLAFRNAFGVSPGDLRATPDP